MCERRQVKPTDTRLKVVNVQDPRIVVTIPADNIKWVVIQHELGEAIFFLDDNRVLARLVVRRQTFGPTDVALGIGRALEKLTMLIAIALWSANVASAFDDEEAVRSSGEMIPVE